MKKVNQIGIDLSDGVDATVYSMSRLLKEYKRNINDLEKCFYDASKLGKKYVAVKIQMEGFPKPEIIINENANFDSKFVYYKKAYNEDLTLKTFNGIKIIDFAYGNRFDDIEKFLSWRVDNGNI